MNKLIILSITVLSIALVSCKKDKEDDTPEFDKASLLKNVADNIIIPALNDFGSKVENLNMSFQTFSSDKSALNLEAVRNSWKDAYLAWQAVKTYDFGPIRDNGFKGSTGVFPTDTAQVNANITSGTYILGSAENTDAIGFSALDYLLYQADALIDFNSNSNYEQYTSDVIAKMVQETQTVVSAWSSYRNTFVASTGTESTSAFSQLVNEYNRDYELAKNAKLGIPIGKQSLGIQMPEYIEAKFSGFSLPLLNESVAKLKNLFNGVHFNGSTNGIGFDDYLNHLERQSLTSAINSRFSEIISKINTFSNTLEVEMNSNYAELDNLYTLMHGQVVNLKTDMTSAFGVLITYQDNDGD